jgi:putative ABC transport system permease protein
VLDPRVTGEGGRAGMSRSSGIAATFLVSARDLQFRFLRFLLAAVAAGLVFGLALLMSGVSNSFSVEISNTVSALGSPTWIVRAGSPGPFTDPALFPASAVTVIRRAPGITAADPLLVGRALTSGAAGTSGALRDVNLLGVVPGGVGAPAVVAGRSLLGPRTTVVDESLGARVGQWIVLNGQRFKVVGLVDGVTYFAGEPVVFVTLPAAQRLDLGGGELATAVLARGTPDRGIAGFTVLDDAGVRADLARPTAQAEKTIQLIEVLLWLVAAGIIGAIVYLQALERRRDFAVLKAVGTPGSYLFAGLMLQAVFLALCAAAIGILAEAPMSRGSAMAVRLSAVDILAVPVVAILVGMAASVLPARQAARVDPAIAFGSGK